MATPWLAKLTAILLIGLLPCVAMALDEPHPLRLLGHSTLENPTVELDEADWRWLRERRRLVMGVSARLPFTVPGSGKSNNSNIS